MTTEQALIAAVSALAACVVFMAKYVISSKTAQEKREDAIHAQYAIVAERHEQQLEDTRKEFTGVLLDLIGKDRDSEDSDPDSGE